MPRSASAAFDMKAIDLDLDVPEPMAIEAVPEGSATSVAKPADDLPFESAQVSTSVNAGLPDRSGGDGGQSAVWRGDRVGVASISMSTPTRKLRTS